MIFVFAEWFMMLYLFVRILWIPALVLGFVYLIAYICRK